MGYFQYKPIPPHWDTQWLKEMLLQLANKLNFLADENFPNTLTGDTLIAAGSVTPNRLKFIEMGAFVALATAYTTSSTSLVPVGRKLRYDPDTWPIDETQVYLDVTGGPTGAANAVVAVQDSVGATLCTVTLNASGWSQTVFSALPAAADSIILKIRTTDGGVPAELYGAAVVVKP